MVAGLLALVAAGLAVCGGHRVGTAQMQFIRGVCDEWTLVQKMETDFKEEIAAQRADFEKQLDAARLSGNANCERQLQSLTQRLESNAENAANQLDGCQQDRDKVRMKLDGLLIKQKTLENRSLPNHQLKLKTAAGLYFLSNEKTSWADALQRCGQAGLQLVTFESEEESSAVAKALGVNYENFWSSGTDLGGSARGKFYWAATGRALEAAGFSGWKQGEPNNYGGNQQCVHVHHTAQQPNRLFWHDEKCDYPTLYMCQLKP